jgi:hypothetical protein
MPSLESTNRTSEAPCGPLVAVGKRMVPREVGGEDRRLVEEVGVELLSAEAGLWRLER